MGTRKTALLPNEIYHVYNRGAHKADVFRGDADYLRMQILMHVCNTSKNIRLLDVWNRCSGNFVDAFDEDVDHSLVDVLAYCLMKNHIHLLVRQKTDNGLQKYMQKIMTGYSMYSNKRYGHSGTLWEGRFKSKHVDTDAYLWQLFAYIHVNPVEYKNKLWKADKTLDVNDALEYLQAYYQSSFIDFYPTLHGKKSLQEVRPHSRILTQDESYTQFVKQFPHPKRLVQYYLEQDFSD